MFLDTTWSVRACAAGNSTKGRIGGWGGLHVTNLARSVDPPLPLPRPSAADMEKNYTTSQEAKLDLFRILSTTVQVCIF